MKIACVGSTRKSRSFLREEPGYAKLSRADQPPRENVCARQPWIVSCPDRDTVRMRLSDPQPSGHGPSAL